MNFLLSFINTVWSASEWHCAWYRCHQKPINHGFSVCGAMHIRVYYYCYYYRMPRKYSNSHIPQWGLYTAEQRHPPGQRYCSCPVPKPLVRTSGAASQSATASEPAWISSRCFHLSVFNSTVFIQTSTKYKPYCKPLSTSRSSGYTPAMSSCCSAHIH